ncbi:MAG: Nif3-like dinuclear metal center hexameric protein [Clostridia bacterium]|nr:Nif3-like dinuclear metal center hexameric protein [Clostridia bacterium]
MKAFEIMDKLFALSDKRDFSSTCDTLKAGDGNVDTQKVAVAMFATPKVVNAVKEWGAQLLIVHEPTYYNHMDNHSDEKIECEKRALIEKSGLTIYRFHDHPHYTTPDIIAAGQLKTFDLKGSVEYTDVFDLVRIHLDEPMTPVQLAKRIEEKCGIKHVRICGARDAECTAVSCMFGQPGGVFDELKNEQSEIVITGEACEWSIGEYARDAAELGHKKALLILGHEGSERDGMIYTAKLLEKMCPELDVKYFECGEVYTYTDS